MKNWRGRPARLGPVLIAAVMFSVSDIAGKYSLETGSDVLTLLSFRSVVGIALLFGWMRLGSAPATLPVRPKWISIGLGLLLTLNLFWVFKAIELVPVSIAILTYFIYPLLTGLAGAVTGIDRMTWRGFIAAVVAFVGLSLIIGAHPVQLEVLGLLAAVGAAFARMAMLLVTRATLVGADARLVTWYTLWSSMAVFVGVSLATWNWHAPHTAVGWVAFVGIGFTTTTAILTLYVSTQRIGPFRTALFMNLEPLITAVLSAILLGDHLTAIQMAGGVIMIAALCAFQLRR
ncbi:MAG: DMT family transporter [Xanthobacteraceae bacterium]|nr:DMT family transporter [Xanthobacteraceae bacterium]